MESNNLYSRRILLRLGLVGGAGLATLALVGCGDDDDEADPTATSGSGADARPTATTAAAADPTATTGAGGGTVLSLVNGWYKGNEVKYYDFGSNTPLAEGSSILAAPIYAFITGMDADGNPQFVEGQHNIVGVVPGDDGYSDLWRVNLVTVTDDYQPDSITNVADVMSAPYETTQTDIFVNCPIIAEGTTLEEGEEIIQGWHNDTEVFYPDFGANPPAAIPILAFITGMDAAGNPQFVDGQMNIIDSVPDDAGYSAFWRVNLVMVPEEYEANSMTDAADVRASDYEVIQADIVVNCPVTVF